MSALACMLCLHKTDLLCKLRARLFKWLVTTGFQRYQPSDSEAISEKKLMELHPNPKTTPQPPSTGES